MALMDLPDVKLSLDQSMKYVGWNTIKYLDGMHGIEVSLNSICDEGYLAFLSNPEFNFVYITEDEDATE